MFCGEGAMSDWIRAAAERDMQRLIWLVLIIGVSISSVGIAYLRSVGGNEDECRSDLKQCRDDVAVFKAMASDLEQDLVDCQIQLRGARLEGDKRQPDDLSATNLVQGEDVYLRCSEGDRCSRIFLDTENRVQIEPYSEVP